MLHDSKNDSAALHFGWNVKLDNVFDTQVPSLFECVITVVIACANFLVTVV